jgi:hypothetical protein
MTEPSDPAWAVRCAWSVFRLPALQGIVNETIAELQRLEPSALLGRELSSLDQQVEPNPIRAALEAFSEELRDESGIADSTARRTSHSQRVREHKAQQPSAWSETYEEALGKYRRAAGEALQVSLHIAPAPD